jgi:hypothetical protein
MENAVIFYYHLDYFTVIWYNLWPFGIVCSHLVYFSRVGMFGPRKIWQPWPTNLLTGKKNLHPDIFFSRRFIVQKKAQEVILAKNADVMLNAQTIGASRRVAKKIKISFSFFLSLSLQTLFPLCAA